MQWWCAARGVPWDWTWQPYPGVWAFIVLLAVAYARTVGRDAEGARRRWFAAGLVVLWAGLDWPLGPLGAGHLATVHVLQFLLVGLVAPACILLGLPRSSVWPTPAPPPSWLTDITHPVVAFCAFNVVMTVTHWPAVSDAFMATQLGAFAVDVTWLGAGLLFWWPIILDIPARPRFGPMLQVVYLALNGLLVRPPAAIMLFSEHPVYATYELAPPFPGWSTLDDQQFAGGIMKAGTAWIMAVAIGVVVWRWHRRST